MLLNVTLSLALKCTDGIKVKLRHPLL